MSLLNPAIRTDRLLLRPPAARDVLGLFQLYSNPATTEFEPHKPTDVSVAKYAGKVEEWRQTREKGENCFMVLLKPVQDPQQTFSGDGEVIGMGGINCFKTRDGKRYADVGVALDSSEWRKGFGREALAAIIEFALNDAQCDGIECQTMAANRAFRKLMSSMGLGDYAKTYNNGDFDERDYSFTKEQWHAARKS